MNIKQLNQYYAQRSKAVADAQRQAIEQRERHASKIKSTASHKKLKNTNTESKDALRSSRAYDAIYRAGNNSPLKMNDSSARKQPSPSRRAYQNEQSFEDDQGERNNRGSYRVSSPISSHYEKVSSQSNLNSGSKQASLRKSEAEIAALANNFKRYLKARPTGVASTGNTANAKQTPRKQ